MKKIKIVIISSVVAVAVLGSLFSWYSAHKVDARTLAIFHVFVQPVDAETKENLRVTVQSPTSELSRITGKNGQGPVPCILETPPGGAIRMTWIDLKDSGSSIVLKAEGYESLRLPSELIEVTQYFDSLAGSRRPDEVLMRKTQPVGATNDKAAASSR